MDSRRRDCHSLILLHSPLPLVGVSIATMLGSASKITVSRTAKAWSTFQRNTRGLRWLVRYQLIFCVVLILTLPFAWVLIKSSCSDMIETTFAGECAAATNGTACLAMRAGFVSTGDDPHVAPECVWVCLTLVGSQVSGPQVCPESVVDGSCTTIIGETQLQHPSCATALSRHCTDRHSTHLAGHRPSSHQPSLLTLSQCLHSTALAVPSTHQATQCFHSTSVFITRNQLRHPWTSTSHRRDCHSADPPSPFSSRFNVDGDGVLAKRPSRRRLTATAVFCGAADKSACETLIDAIECALHRVVARCSVAIPIATC